MNEQKVIVSVDTYTEMIATQMKLKTLRETLEALPEYDWAKVIRVALGIEGGAE